MAIVLLLEVFISPAAALPVTIFFNIVIPLSNF